MAKRAPTDEQPYRPLLDLGVIEAALTKTGPIAPPSLARETAISPLKVVEISRPEAIRPQQQPVWPEASPSVAGRVDARAVPQVLVEKFDQEKRILLTRSEAATLDRLVSTLAGRLGTQIKLSHVLRSMITLLLNAEREVDRRAGEAGVFVRPPNGDGKALQRFEKELAGVLGSALRDAGAIR